MRGARLSTVLMAVGGMLAGCARSEPTAVTDADGYLPAASAALIYTPPVYLALDPGEQDALNAELARFGRGPEAVLGYDSPTLSTYFLEVDDRQRIVGGGYRGGYGLYGGYGYGGSGIYDVYRRRAISTETFTRTRLPQ